MSKTKPASDMLARFRKTAEQPKPVAVVAPEVEEPLVSPPEAAAPAKPAGKGRIVRITLDLEATQHKFLKRLALEEDLSVSDLLRAVVGLLEEDPELARRVAERARGGRV
jgi:hypothetical protein